MLACDSIRFSSHFVAGDVSRETSLSGKERGETDVFAGYMFEQGAAVPKRA